MLFPSFHGSMSYLCDVSGNRRSEPGNFKEAFHILTSNPKVVLL